MSQIAEMSESIAGLMDEILSHFKPGTKITLLIRTHDKPEADFCMSNDDLTELPAMIERRLAAGQTVDGVRAK